MPRNSGIAWLTTLSLDAPLVCVAWQHLVAFEQGQPIAWHHRFLVFASVWLGYSADRWFDAWRHKANVSHRHRFFYEHRWGLFITWLGVLTISLTVALRLLSGSELQAGLQLAIASIGVTTIVQFIPLRVFQTLLKSLLTAGLVTASVLLFAPPASGTEGLASACLLGSLFATNCCLIHYWDWTIDTLQEADPVRSRRQKSLLLCSSVCCLSLLWFRHSPLALPVAICLICLAGLHLARRSIRDDTRRTWADLCLAGPPILAMWL